MRKVSEYSFAPYLFRPNKDQFTTITRIEYVLFTWTIIMERYVTTTYRPHEVHVCVLGGYVPTTYAKYKLNATCPLIRL